MWVCINWSSDSEDATRKDETTQNQHQTADSPGYVISTAMNPWRAASCYHSWESLPIGLFWCGLHITYFFSFLAVLTEDGHQITLEEVEDRNIVELLVNGEVVFHCNIQDLEFGEAIGTLPTLYDCSGPISQFLATVFSGTFPDSSWFSLWLCYSKPCPLYQLYPALIQNKGVSVLWTSS